MFSSKDMIIRNFIRNSSTVRVFGLLELKTRTERGALYISFINPRELWVEMLPFSAKTLLAWHTEKTRPKQLSISVDSHATTSVTVYFNTTHFNTTIQQQTTAISNTR